MQPCSSVMSVRVENWDLSNCVRAKLYSTVTGYTMLLCRAGNTSAILVASDAEAASQAARQVQTGKYGFVWTQLNDLSSFYFERWEPAVVEDSTSFSGLWVQWRYDIHVTRIELVSKLGQV